MTGIEHDGHQPVDRWFAGTRRRLLLRRFRLATGQLFVQAQRLNRLLPALQQRHQWISRIFRINIKHQTVTVFGNRRQ